MQGKENSFVFYNPFFAKSVPVDYIPLRSFMDWFENILNEKYDASLQGLKFRFLTFYNIMKGVLTYILELNKLVCSFIHNFLLTHLFFASSYWKKPMKTHIQSN